MLSIDTSHTPTLFYQKNYVLTITNVILSPFPYTKRQKKTEKKNGQLKHKKANQWEKKGRKLVLQFEIKSFVLANQTVSSNFSFVLLLPLFSLALFRAKWKKFFFSRETVICSTICWISTLFNKRSNQWTATKDFSKLSYSSLFCCWIWMESFFCSAHHRNTKNKVKTKIKAKRRRSFRFFYCSHTTEFNSETGKSIYSDEFQNSLHQSIITLWITGIEYLIPFTFI